MTLPTLVMPDMHSVLSRVPASLCRAARSAPGEPGATLFAAGLHGHGGVALALVRGHRADLERAFLDLPLDVLELHATPLCCSICLSEHTDRKSTRLNSSHANISH